MGMTKIEAIEYTCDGCGSIQIVQDEMEILGYTGTVIWQHSNGGHSANWYADKPSCIKLAVSNALKEARDND